VALAAGWYLHGVTVADDRRPYTEVWTDADQRTAAHYVEDDLLGAAYVDLQGDAAETWAESLRAQIPVLAPQEIVAWTALVEDPAERIQAVGHLAAVAPEAPRDVVVDVLARLAADPVEAVRGAVLYVCARLAWPDVVALVERLRDADPSPSLRADANRVLTSLREG